MADQLVGVAGAGAAERAGVAAGTGDLVASRASRQDSRWWWVEVTAIWLGTRLASAILFLWLARGQAKNPWTEAAPGYLEYLNIWDSEWYSRIFATGYPTVLPLDEQGLVQQNEWAFLPGFPFLVRAFAWLTGLEWQVAAPIVATAASLGFALVAYRLLRLRFAPAVAAWGVGLVGLSPASLVLQAGYAESLGLLLLAATLLFWLRDRLWLASLAVLALGFTRPGAVAVAMAVGGLLLWRLWRERAAGGLFGWFRSPANLRQIGFAAVASVAGLAWTFVAWLVTNRTDAYLATELAWRRGYGSDDSLHLVQPWFVSANFWLGRGTGTLLVLAVLGFAVWLFFTPAVRALGERLLAFNAAYLLYLLLVFFPQSSTVRILFPAFTLLGAFALKVAGAKPGSRLALIALALVLQWGWLLACWQYLPPDYSPP